MIFLGASLITVYIKSFKLIKGRVDTWNIIIRKQDVHKILFSEILIVVIFIIAGKK